MSSPSRIASALVLLIAATSQAQPRAATTAPARSSRPSPIVTREDLARAYVRAERAMHEHPPATPSERAAANRAMDRAAYQFFAADHAGAMRTMNELTDVLRGAPAPGTDGHPDLVSLVRSLKVTVSPRIAHVHRPSIFNLRAVPVYHVPLPEEPLELRVVVREDQGGGKVVFDQPFVLSESSALPSISTRQPDVEPGSYGVQVVAPDGQAVDVGRWFVVERSLDQIRSGNERRLLGVNARDFKMFQAVEACRSRNALLTDRPSESESSQFLADPVTLAKDVEAEVQALQKGTDPYERRAGDYWRGVPAGAMLIPARVYAPPQVNDDNAEAMPLVIALHGAGGDENAFMEGYGAGAIKRLADRHGFVVVAPSTYWVMLNPSSLDALVDSMVADYPIDRARVYLVGHSLGAIATEPILQRQARDVAGAVLIAGGKAARGDDGKACPTLLVAGELDPVAPPHQVAGAAERAKASGLPVEFLLVRDAGHIFVAGAALPQAVEWLLPKRGQAKRE